MEFICQKVCSYVMSKDLAATWDLATPSPDKPPGVGSVGSEGSSWPPRPPSAAEPPPVVVVYCK